MIYVCQINSLYYEFKNKNWIKFDTRSNSTKSLKLMNAKLIVFEKDRWIYEMYTWTIINIKILVDYKCVFNRLWKKKFFSR